MNAKTWYDKVRVLQSCTHSAYIDTAMQTLLLKHSCYYDIVKQVLKDAMQMSACTSATYITTVLRASAK
jgi:hypothetical protein